MKITITIHKGRPSKEMLKHIIDQICEGYHTGIGDPEEINWEVDMPHNYREKLINDN